MKKLNQKKIRWIIRWKENGKSVKDLALAQRISERRVKQLWAKYRKTNKIPILSKSGRKSKPIKEEHRRIIEEAYKDYCIGPLALEKVIQRKYKLHIPHNTIYKYMLNNNLIIENPKKKKQRKWVRYEREHSLSLVHTDWCDYKGKQVIAFIDDASRMVLSCAEFNEATTKNTIIALNKAIKFVKPYDSITQLITDHGTQFTANKRDKKGEAEHTFEQYLKNIDIELIHSKIKHPQTNGKIERWFSTYQKHRYRFDNLEDFVDWYNNKKPHMSLNFNKAETPSEAFIRKIRTGIWIGLVSNWF